MTEYAHERISRLIRADLGPPGSELPSEGELMQRFGVGRATIRQALTTLEQEGLITSGRGRRRTVREGRRWHWDMTAWERAHSEVGDAWNNTIRAQGGEPSSQVEVRIVQATPEIADALEIPVGEAIVNRHRIRSVNGEPHQLSDSYFPKWLTNEASLLSQPGDISTKRGLLADSGFPQVRFHDEITARMPTAEETSTLRMPPGTALLVHTRIGYGKDGRPLRYMVTRMAADRVTISYDVDA